jgi:hypothetical protein
LDFYFLFSPDFLTAVFNLVFDFLDFDFLSLFSLLADFFFDFYLIDLLLLFLDFLGLT